jgi:hypothetical protein
MAMVVSNQMVSEQGTTVLDHDWRVPTTESRPGPVVKAPASRPQRSIGVRVSTEFPVLIYDGVVASHCHAVELSSTGIVLERGRSGALLERRGSVRLELFFEHAPRPVAVLARPVRWFGTREAYKFTTIHDADRLTLSEHLDRAHRQGHPLF